MKFSSLVFREDGRLPDELRRLIFLNESPYISLRQGNSHVRVQIDGPKEGSKIFFNISGDRRYPELNSIFSKILLLDTQLDINIEVIEEDGSILSTIVNCIVLSMCHSNIPLVDFPCSVTYSKIGVDLSGQEEGSGKVMAVYLMNSMKIVYYKIEGKMDIEKIERVDEMGREAVKKVYKILRDELLNQ
ncbi:exosome complex component RRP41 (SKI6) [Vairimorpha necatrix]|uniref:Exosome complex component RRP41 (SKI6) n=1 Tax=Vairimorpha necatrix TaxID=6039 RepID=A0AAX4JA97_9MICR